MNTNKWIEQFRGKAEFVDERLTKEAIDFLSDYVKDLISKVREESYQKGRDVGFNEARDFYIDLYKEE